MRNAVVNYHNGEWSIGLMENHEIRKVIITSNYHDFGLIISNWILHGYLS